MPSKKKQAKVNQEYEEKRARNNEAVKRSREKAKERSQEIQSNISRLRSENDSLEEKKKLLAHELKFLKELFIANSSGEFITGQVGPYEFKI